MFTERHGCQPKRAKNSNRHRDYKQHSAPDAFDVRVSHDRTLVGVGVGRAASLVAVVLGVIGIIAAAVYYGRRREVFDEAIDPLDIAASTRPSAGMHEAEQPQASTLNQCGSD